MTESSKPPSGRRMKARAPPPPQAPQPAPRHIFRNAVPEGGGISDIDAKENILRPTVDLQLTLPQGYQTTLREDGRKALMDLLVELCSRFHLNPALHTLELLSPEGHTLAFKPNVLVGSLNLSCVLIKEKVSDEKVVRRPVPKVPEKTIRLMVNYHGTQKAVVRVNPSVPLQTLIPVICEKCEFDPAHVLLLKDSISRHELQLDKSLSELEIKELYVHDQSLVLQPKMASAPALNHSGSIRSSTISLGRPEKKGFLGIFQFNRRKSKGPSTMSGISRVDYQPSSLGQSQSVLNIPRMSPTTQMKKRRAPALPGTSAPTVGHASFESYQTGLGSESQQRKRKAPVPPPSSASMTPGPEDTSSFAAPIPDSHTTETPTPAFCTKEAHSAMISSSTVVTETVKPTAGQPPPVCTATRTNSSPNSSSSTTDSLSVNDSSSELSHSLDDSDPDLDQTGFQRSSLTSSSGSVLVQSAMKSSSNQMAELEKSTSMTAKLNQEVSSASSSRSETDLNLKLDEVENRHSTMGTTDRPAPPKPRRSPAREPPELVLPPTLFSPPTVPTESKSPQSPLETEEAAPQSWLHSMRSTTASGQKPGTERHEEETMSLGSSSGGSSLPDQGYTASEEIAEGEDSGMVSSPSDTQPTSPDGSLSLDGCNRDIGERLLGPVRDNSSDSDEGCATWGSRHRHKDISPQAKSGGLKGSYDDDPELTAQLHQTLADFEANLADHIDLVSVKETQYALSTGSNEVPVSVVDMDVPVTAIDDVLEEYDHKITENEAKSSTGTESAGGKGAGFSHQSSVEQQNKNNNACMAADSNTSSSSNFKQLSQPKQCRNKTKVDKKDEKILERKITEMSISDFSSVKKTSPVKSNVDIQKHSKSREIKHNPVKSNSQEKKPVISPTSQRKVSTVRDEEMHRVYPHNSGSNTLHGKITHNVASRFGMKTFTVVPPKPIVLRAATEVPAVTLTLGAIKIDDQGNMVKAGVGQNKVGGSLESEINYGEDFELLGKAKAFWSSNERQESAVFHNKGLIDKAKGSTDGLKSPPTAVSETTLKTSNIEDLKTSLIKPEERAQPKEMVKREPEKDIKVATEEKLEVESKISVSKHIQQTNSKPNLPDLRKDLSFLKPSRRTSSQYVASAINKYTTKTSANPIPNLSDSSVSLKIQTTGFQRSGRSKQVEPHQSSLSFLSDSKENESSFKLNPSVLKRSLSYPDYVSDSQKDFDEVTTDREAFVSSVVSIERSSTTLITETLNNKPVQSCETPQKNMATNNDRDYIKHIQSQSPGPAHSSSLQPSAKSAPKTTFQGQTSNMRNMTKAEKHLTPGAKPQPSVTDSGVTPGAMPVTVFGPIKKFRPVICRSVEKETSLHSSLMEAIQTGGGKERLKKIHTPGPSSMKKASYVEEENERSALLAAIRAQSSSGRLRKIKSEAADELEKLRKASEQEKSVGAPSSPSSPPLSHTSLPAFTPPPPPQAPLIGPPPPPPLLPQGRPSTGARSSVNAPMNPALAREAMLEAIRSGAAADRLKKVAVPTKTVKVNGRLGTIQATSLTLPQQ